ncbi:nucleolar complex protein 4 [Diutina catenulata]
MPKATKRSASGKTKVAKKAKADAPASCTKSSVTALAKQVSQDMKVNNLVTLLDFYKSDFAKVNADNEELARHLTFELYKVFAQLVSQHKMVVPKNADDKRATAAKWLASKYAQYLETMANFIRRKHSKCPSLVGDCVEIMLQLVKTDAATRTDAYFPEKAYNQLRMAVLMSHNEFVVVEFATKYLRHYRDLRFYFFRSLDTEVAERKRSEPKAEVQRMFCNFFTVVEHMRDEPEEAWTVRPPQKTETKFPTVFQKATLAMLSCPLEEHHYQLIMQILHKRIIPHMASPPQLLDFLVECYDQGGELALLTLNSLWELMKGFNLEYPDFYTKLYSLIDADMMASAYRSRFLRLCDLFLSSTHLSAQVVASFIKRLARVALTAEAPGCVVVIPFVYNLIKRHPTCMILLHNPDGARGRDPYDVHEANPLKTGAIESSAWELEALMTHYHPNIATLAKILGEPFRKLSYNLEDFLDWSYQSLLEAESTKRYKGTAALEFEEFTSVFGSEDSSYMTGWVI